MRISEAVRRPSFGAFVLRAIAALALQTGLLSAEPAVREQAASHEPIPNDLPLPASAPLDARWLREAIVLQPYGHSAYALLTDAERPGRLNREFGFNVVIVQPPDSHNTIARPEDQLTEEQFRAGLERCRAVGYRVLLYTSVMALGLSPEFQSGQIGREHPNWLQRDAKGNHIMVWGVPWLCPNSGARDLALERCRRIVREYEADGVMLDNNQFFMTDTGWTCHCENCTRAFREYVQNRFGTERATRLFGAEPSKLVIPTEKRPLHALWLHWRNRVWANVNESFRARLRADRPEIMLFANTQYKFDNGLLASDLQYEREDVVLSESVGLNSRQMSEKMVLGHALAAGRPLFNYIGTFSKFDDYTGMLPAEVVQPMIAATLAHNARPWIVDGFDDGPTDAASRQSMAGLLRWYGDHPQHFNHPRWSAVATLVSPTSRNVLSQSLIPPHIAALQSTGVPVIALRDDGLTSNQLTPFRVLTVETSGYLSENAAAMIAKWVKDGGTLVAARDTGSHDELGRKLPTSRLWDALNLSAAPKEPLEFGRGKIIAVDASEFTANALGLTKPHSFLADETGSPAEIVAYRAPNSLLLHVLCHQPVENAIALRLAESLPPTTSTAKLYTPEGGEPKTLTVKTIDNRKLLRLDKPPTYNIVEIPIQ